MHFTFSLSGRPLNISTKLRRTRRLSPLNKHVVACFVAKIFRKTQNTRFGNTDVVLLYSIPAGRPYPPFHQFRSKAKGLYLSNPAAMILCNFFFHKIIFSVLFFYLAEFLLWSIGVNICAVPVFVVVLHFGQCTLSETSLL